MTINFTWLGCAAYILDLDGTRLLFDPFFYRNDKARPILKTKREDIKDISAVFISHGHFDHATDGAWFAENLDIPVYCCDKTKLNMINFAEGKILKRYSHPISEKGKNNIKVIKFSDKIKINEQVEVEVVKSRHIKFDKETIEMGLNPIGASEKEIRLMMKLGTGFRLGKVFAFYVSFNGIKILSYGSLFHKYTDILKKYVNCDIFIIPIAGNSKENCVIKGGQMVDILKPKLIIPTHWDAFYFPLKSTDTGPFQKYVEKKHPETKILKPIIDESLILN